MTYFGQFPDDPYYMTAEEEQNVIDRDAADAHYRVVEDDFSNGCKHCERGKHWTIAHGRGDDEIAVGTSWGDKGLADDICDLMNDAYAAGGEGISAHEPRAEQPDAYRLDYTAGNVEAFQLTTPGSLPLDLAQLREDGRTNIRQMPLYRHAPPPGAWLPIESAPRYMSIIVLSNGDRFEAYQDSIGTWHCMDGTNGRMTVLIVTPECWMPFPEGPTATKLPEQVKP